MARFIAMKAAALAFFLLAFCLLTLKVGFSTPLITQEPLLSLRIDIRNLVSSDGSEHIDEKKVASLIERVNVVYKQCQVSFVSRHILNVAADSLAVKIPPQSEAEVAAIGDKFNPQGFAPANEAIPVTFAGRFEFYAANYGVNVNALTWSFTSSGKVVRVHSMVARQRLDQSLAVETLAHEFGHLFLLNHSAVPGNIMGAGLNVSPEQCQQVRSYASKFYQPMMQNALATL
jgi:hypothetical protein